MHILIIWGGYGLHQPQKTSDQLTKLLKKRGYFVTATSDFCIVLNEDLKNYDVIVPIWSCGVRGDAYFYSLVKAVENGLGLACFHGGIDWFDQREFYQLIGSLYINDSNYESFHVRLSDNCKGGHFDGLKDFQGSGEVYNCMFDPSNQVIASIEAGSVIRPYAWIKHYGKGKVFYSMGAHDFDTLFNKDCIDLIIRGIEWSAREKGNLT